jgi:ABC-type polysaccharide/polyol phosphate export permease
MFASAVVYPVDGLTGWFGAIIRANPMTSIVEAYRSVVLYGQPPDASFLWAAAISLVSLPAAWLLFHRSEFQFAERI